MQVADFGLAKFTSDTNTHVSTRVMGTFGWVLLFGFCNLRSTISTVVFFYLFFSVVPLHKNTSCVEILLRNKFVINFLQRVNIISRLQLYVSFATFLILCCFMLLYSQLFSSRICIKWQTHWQIRCLFFWGDASRAYYWTPTSWYNSILHGW